MLYLLPYTLQYIVCDATQKLPQLVAFLQESCCLSWVTAKRCCQYDSDVIV